jgi:hypothetical protein
VALQAANMKSGSQTRTIHSGLSVILQQSHSELVAATRELTGAIKRSAALQNQHKRFLMFLARRVRWSLEQGTDKPRA